MILTRYKIFLLLFFLCSFCLDLSAQKLTGIWRGYFITEGGEQYRLEFQVQQNSSSNVTGVSYSYLDTRFYGKASMTGNFAVKNKAFQIQETRTTEVKNLGGGGTCLMNYKFSYARSGKEEFLEGTYVGKSEDRLNPKNNGVWGDCGGGKVYLRRVENSDFYVEPFLREKPIAKSAVKKPIAKNAIVKKTTAPINKTNLPPKTSITKKPATKPPVKKETATTKTKIKEVEKADVPVVKETPKKIIPKAIFIPLQTRSRKNELIKNLIVTSEEITIKLYDNGEIDDDTISVYMDNKALLSNKRLSASPIVLKIKMDEENPEHVLVMVAENFGRIPPNTSLMIVNDGDKRYEVRITTTEQKNAMIRFTYQKSSL
jgi:hypothetical protein